MSNHHKDYSQLFSRQAGEYEELLQSFENAWNDGQRPAIEDYLPATESPIPIPHLVELVFLDLEMRLKDGDEVRIESYLRRFPQLAEDQSRIVELLVWEFGLRKRQNPDLTTKEYGQRFPNLFDSFQSQVNKLDVTSENAASDESLPDLISDQQSTYVSPGSEAKPSIEETGPNIPGYEVLSKLGEGGMGAVYRARDPDFERTLAIKVMLPKALQIPSAENRFLEEAKITGQLQHPGIPPVHDLGRLDDGMPFFAMKLIKGRTLADLLKERNSEHKTTGKDVGGESLADGSNSDSRLPTPDSRLIHIFGQVCQTIGYVHSRGVIHRDLKPANIMVGAFGEVQVMDWGLAKVIAKLAEEKDAPGTDSSTIRSLQMRGDLALSQTGDVMGTPAYMAPEQARGEMRTLDPRADVFGLGAILCEILTGKPAFQGQTSMDLILQAIDGNLSDAFTRLDACRADAELIGLCKKCLAPDKKDRPRHGGVVAEALAAHEQGVEEKLRQAELHRAQAQVQAAEERKRRRWQLGLAAVIVLGLTIGIAGAVWGLLQVDHARRDALAARQAEAKRAAGERTAKLAAQDAAEAERLARRDSDKKREHIERLLYAHQIKSADHQWFANNAREARAVLAKTRPDLRGWEYYYLKRLFNRGVLAQRLHTGAVRTVSFSPDGKRIVSGCYGLDGNLRMFDAETGQELWTQGYTGFVDSVSFSPIGKHIVTGRFDRTLKVRDAATGQELFTLRGHTGIVNSVSFSPDGKRVVSGSHDNTLKVWNAETGQELLTSHGHAGPVSSVSFSPDGKRVISGSHDNTLKVWGTEKGKELLTIPGHTGIVNSVNFSPNGKRIVSGSWDKTLKVWDAETGQELLTIPGHTSSVNSVSFSPDGKRIVSGSADQALKVWDAETGQELFTLRGHTGMVNSVSFSPDGKRIVSGSWDKMLKVWDAEIGQQLLTLRGHTGPVSSVSFSPDDKRIVSGSAADQALKVWDAEKGQQLLTLRGHTGMSDSVSFSPDGKRIVSGSHDKTLKVWDTETGQQLLTLPGHTGDVNSVSFSPDGQRIVSGSWDKTLKVWDTETGQQLLTLPGHTGIVNSVSFSPDGKRIVSGSWDKMLKVWDAEIGQQLLTLRGHTGPVSSVSFSPDGQRIVSGSSDKTLKVWDAETGQELLTLRGHTSSVFSVCFSPDGKRIVSGSFDKTLKVWDAETGQEFLTLREHTGSIRSVRFSPDGKRIVSGSDDKTLKVWEADVAVSGLPPAEPPGVSEVVTSLGHKAAWRQMQATMALVRHGVSAVPALKIALRSKKVVVRRNAAKALRLIGAPAQTAISDLTQALNDRDEAVRLQAAIALTGLGERKAVPALIDLSASTEAGVQREASRALAKLGAVAELAKALSAKDPTTRLGAVAALKQIGPPAKEALPQLLPLLTAKDDRLRREAVQAVLAFGQPQTAVTFLIERLKEKEASVRLHAASALADFGSRARIAIPQLMVSLKDKDASVRKARARNLGTCRSE